MVGEGTGGSAGAVDRRFFSGGDNTERRVGDSTCRGSRGQSRGLSSNQGWGGWRQSLGLADAFRAAMGSP